MTEMEYSATMSRFIIRVKTDVEKMIPESILDSTYNGLRGRALKKEIYRKTFELVNSQTLSADALEQYFIMDNRGA